MHLERYDFRESRFRDFYEFESVGPKGRILKRVEFTLVPGTTSLYNLGFGDLDPQTDQINDKVVSNNGDWEKVLATVITALYDFTNLHPSVWVYAAGSTTDRTRLYQMGINRYREQALQDYRIYGEFNEAFIPFESATNYNSFLVQRMPYLSV